MLWSVKCIRNSSAHNNCLLHNLKPNSYKILNEIIIFLYTNLGMSKEAIRKKCLFLLYMILLFYF